MNDSRLIRAGTAAAVLLVAAIAAVISYVHIQHLGVTHGQTMLASALLPVSIDGTVAAASLVMLRAARAGLGTPWLARFMLVLAVAATLACNILYGASFGVTGALLSGWPAAAFIGCAEMALGMIRRAGGVPTHTPAEETVSEAVAATVPADVPVNTVPADVTEAAKASLRATVAAGNPWSVNALAEQFSLTRAAATRVHREVLAESNGHTPEAIDV